MTQALELVVRGLDVFVRNQDDLDLDPCFKLGDFSALFIEQVGGHLDRHLSMHGSSVLLDGFFLDHAEHVQGRRFDVADHTSAVASRARDMCTLVERRAQPLARQLHQPEARNLAGLDPCSIVVQRVLAALLDLALVLRAFHVDEVDDDQPAEVAQAHLAGHLVGRFKIGAKRGFLDVGALGGSGRIDVDRNQRFGVVDHDRAAGGQGHQPRIGGFDLMLDLKAGKKRRVVTVAFDAPDHVRHDMPHELLGLLADIVGIKENLADVGGEIIADCTNHQARFLIDQEGARGRSRRRLDGAPQLHHVAEVPLELFLGATQPGRTRNQAHAGRQFEPVHDLAQFLALLTFNTTRHTAAARVIGHQNKIAPGQRNIGCECRTLVAALFLFDLNEQLLAFGDRILDTGFRGLNARLEIGFRDFLEGQKTVTVFAIVHKAGLETGLDPGDNALIDIALSGLAPRRLDVDIDELLAIDDRDAQLFRVRRIEQHAFHSKTSDSRNQRGARGQRINAGISDQRAGRLRPKRIRFRRSASTQRPWGSWRLRSIMMGGAWMVGC